MKKIIAETTLIHQDPFGARRPVRLYIRAPYDLNDGSWGCYCHAEGLLEKETRICGEDSFQVLCLTIRFLKVFLDCQASKGASFYIQGDESKAISADLCFGCPEEAP